MLEAELKFSNHVESLTYVLIDRSRIAYERRAATRVSSSLLRAMLIIDAASFVVGTRLPEADQCRRASENDVELELGRRQRLHEFIGDPLRQGADDARVFRADEDVVADANVRQVAAQCDTAERDVDDLDDDRDAVAARDRDAIVDRLDAFVSADCSPDVSCDGSSRPDATAADCSTLVRWSFMRASAEEWFTSCAGKVAFKATTRAFSTAATISLSRDWPKHNLRIDGAVAPSLSNG